MLFASLRIVFGFTRAFHIVSLRVCSGFYNFGFAVRNCTKDLSGLSCAQGLLFASYVDFVIRCHRFASYLSCWIIYLASWISSWNFAKELQWSYDLNNRGAFKHFHFMCFRLIVLLLCIAILAWNCHSLHSLARNKQSNHQGLEHCRAFDKGVSLHRSIMPTTGELTKRKEFWNLNERRGRKTAFTKLRATI